jgi:hypothetical protein
MAAPTNAANMKKTLANSEPSTHGTWRTCHAVMNVRFGGNNGRDAMSAFDPKQTLLPTGNNGSPKVPLELSCHCYANPNAKC